MLGIEDLAQLHLQAVFESSIYLLPVSLTFQHYVDV